MGICHNGKKMLHLPPKKCKEKTLDAAKNNTPPNSERPQGSEVTSSADGEFDFQRLLQLAAQGDSAAQQQICNHYEQQVLIAARIHLGPLLRPHLDSIDIVQSVHRSLLLGLRDEKYQISNPERLIGLACTMARRKVARKWRVHRRQLQLTDRSSQSLAHILTSLSNSGETPSERASFNEQVEKLCENLNNVERVMLEMRLAGFTTGEVAEHLGINPVAIRVRWSRLRQRLHSSGIFADWI